MIIGPAKGIPMNYILNSTGLRACRTVVNTNDAAFADAQSASMMQKAQCHSFVHSLTCYGLAFMKGSHQAAAELSRAELGTLCFGGFKEYVGCIAGDAVRKCKEHVRPRRCDAAVWR